MPPNSNWPLKRIVSGGQTGVDRAALDAAIAAGVEHGGWCPRGRLAEDGTISSHYQLQEMSSPEYPLRTEQNVVDSDGTLILYDGRMFGGTLLTATLAERHGKPCLPINLASPLEPSEIAHWLQQHKIEVLNVAGPRESSSPGIGLRVAKYLAAVLAFRPRH